MSNSSKYWLLPLLAAFIWLVTLGTMLIVWYTNGQPHYGWMDRKQTFPYISDIGATAGMKALLIAGSTTTVILFNICVILERYLRHEGRLARNTSKDQKWLSVLAILFAFVGGVGLIALTILDTHNYSTEHNIFLIVFIVGYLIAAIFICWEYGLLEHDFHDQRLRISFFLKLFFIVAEIALAAVFQAYRFREEYNRAAIFGWIVALVYIVFVASFAYDFAGVAPRGQKYSMARIRR